MKNILISLVNYNGKKNTLECLDSIKNLKIDSFNPIVLVVDNMSNEKFNIKESYLPNIPLKIILNKNNLGFAGGHNIGISYALNHNIEYTLILNNDTYVDSNLIENLLQVFGESQDIGIVAPKIYFAPGFEFHKKRYKKTDQGKVIWYAGGEMDWKNITGKHRGVDEIDERQYEKISETDFASGAGMFVKNEVFNKIGKFNEKYFLYYEDSDFCLRTIKAGFKVIFAPKAILWHKNAGSTGGSGSELQDYYLSRNRLLFGVKYAPFKSKLALLKESISILGKGRKWQKKGILDFYLGRFGKGSYKI